MRGCSARFCMEGPIGLGRLGCRNDGRDGAESQSVLPPYQTLEHPQRNGNLVAEPSSYLWLASNEGVDPYSSPYITHDENFHVLFHPFIPS